MEDVLAEAEPVPVEVLDADQKDDRKYSSESGASLPQSDDPEMTGRPRSDVIRLHRGWRTLFHVSRATRNKSDSSSQLGSEGSSTDCVEEDTEGYGIHSQYEEYAVIDKLQDEEEDAVFDQVGLSHQVEGPSPGHWWCRRIYLSQVPYCLRSWRQRVVGGHFRWHKSPVFFAQDGFIDFIELPFITFLQMSSYPFATNHHISKTACCTVRFFGADCYPCLTNLTRLMRNSWMR